MRARGTLTLAAQPTVGDTMTIGSTVYTFRANGSKLETPEAPNRRPAGPYGGQRRDRGDDSRDPKHDNPGDQPLGTTGFRASTTAEKNVVAADRWVSNTLVLTAAEDGTGGNAIATHSTFAKSSNKFDDTTLGSTSEGRDPDPAVAAQGTLSITAPAPGQTFTIKGRIYTFDANGALDDTTADHIEIGSGIGDPQNIINAINATSPGTGFSTPTTQNADVTAAPGAPAAAIVLPPKRPRRRNAITTAETMAAGNDSTPPPSGRRGRAGTPGRSRL